MNEAAISLLFDEARAELDKIDTQAHGAKKRVVKDLAKNLEDKLPMKEIAEEIAHQLEGKVSKSVVYEALDDRYKNVNRVKAQKEAKQNLSPISDLEAERLITVGNTGEQEVTIANEPYAKGAKRDRHASRPELQATKIQELEALCMQKDKALIDLQDKLKHVDKSGYNADVTQELLDAQVRIKELEQPFTFKLRVDIGRHRPLAEVRVRPAMKEVVSVTFPEEELPSEMFA